MAGGEDVHDGEGRRRRRRAVRGAAALQLLVYSVRGAEQRVLDGRQLVVNALKELQNSLVSDAFKTGTRMRRRSAPGGAAWSHSKRERSRAGERSRANATLARTSPLRVSSSAQRQPEAARRAAAQRCSSASGVTQTTQATSAPLLRRARSERRRAAPARSVPLCGPGGARCLLRRPGSGTRPQRGSRSAPRATPTHPRHHNFDAEVVAHFHHRQGGEQRRLSLQRGRSATATRVRAAENRRHSLLPLERARTASAVEDIDLDSVDSGFV